MFIGDDIMAKRITYPNIDLQQTGRKLKHILESAGYTPRMIQEKISVSGIGGFGLTVQ